MTRRKVPIRLYNTIQCCLVTIPRREWIVAKIVETSNDEKPLTGMRIAKVVGRDEPVPSGRHMRSSPYVVAEVDQAFTNNFPCPAIVMPLEISYVLENHVAWFVLLKNLYDLMEQSPPRPVPAAILVT